MSSPTPLQSFLGGLGMSLPIHALLVLNGSVLGVSGFMHSAVSGGVEPAFAVAGLVLGGVCVGVIGGPVQETAMTGLGTTLFSGLLVGIGSKFMNGCTSGHMVAGLSRLSLRSLVATGIFCCTGVVVSHLLYQDVLPPIKEDDWSLKANGSTLFLLQAVPLAISALLFLSATITNPPSNGELGERPLLSFRRAVAGFLTSFGFGVSLYYSNLVEPLKVTSFLLLPPHNAFDPSLAFLAAGALPTTFLLYKYYRGNEQPRLGGAWCVPKPGKVDASLVWGAILFGIGWGVRGVCPGPGLVNFGRALATGYGMAQAAVWLGSFIAGGLVAKAF